jgi:naphtho-gamma-pyrone polyketide synthase
MSGDDVGLNCAEMKVDRPLIATTDLSCQMLRLSATANWSRNEVSLVFFSIDSKSNKEVNHATCLVKITHTPASKWLQEWKRMGYLIQGRISSLQKGVHDGQSHKLRRGLAYRLFSSLVDYADDYQGMQEVTLDTEEFEATAQVVFQTGDNGFDWNPCWIDSLGHIAGFIMNGNDNMYSKDHIFVNHGWGAMRCAKKIEHNKTYQTYNKMHSEDEKGNIFVGDTYILEDGMIVAIFEGVKV